MKTTMKAVQVLAKGEPMRLVEVPIPQPEEGQVLIRVEACGICHGDSKVIEGWASEYPRIPGHEVVGTIEKLGKNISKWEVGQRVGIGWHGGHGHTTALSIDGGYAEYMVAYEDGLILIPEGITSEEAAPLLCAGSYRGFWCRRLGTLGCSICTKSRLSSSSHFTWRRKERTGYEVRGTPLYQFGQRGYSAGIAGTRRCKGYPCYRTISKSYFTAHRRT